MGTIVLHGRERLRISVVKRLHRLFNKCCGELLAENLNDYKMKWLQCFPFDGWEVAISIRSIFAVLWLLACGIWLVVATFQQGLLSWDALELPLGESNLLRYFLTSFVVALPAALLLCGRYNHGARDGMLLLLLALLIGFAIYTHQESSTSLTEQTVCIALGVGIAEVLARILGLWLDAPEVRSARKGVAYGGRTKSSRRSSRQRSER